MKVFKIGKYFSHIFESGCEDLEKWEDLQCNEMRIKKEAIKKNAMALFYIQIALEKSLFPRIIDA